MSHSIKYKASIVSYQVFGSGNELLLAFPGYGKDAASLSILGDTFGNRFKVISIDVFYHGLSTWEESQLPNADDWKQIVTAILAENGNPQKFSVFGYSIGGRVATFTAFHFAERVNLLWLAAATGIGNEGFYTFAVGTSLGNFMFSRFVNRPTPIFAFAKLLGSTLQGFIMRKIDTFEKRNLLYKRWRVLKNFSCSKNQLQQRLNANGCRVVLLYGKKDVVVNYKAAIAFAQKLNHPILLLPDAGHHLLDNTTLERIKGEAVFSEH